MKRTIILLSTAILYLNSCKQKSFLTEMTSKVRIVNDSLSIKAGITGKKISYDLGYTYYGYQRGHITQTQGFCQGKALDGEYLSSFRSNGKMESHGTFKMGLKEGDWLYWSQQGTLLKLTHYHKGKEDGKSYRYNNEGKIIDTIIFQNGKEKQSKAKAPNKTITKVKQKINKLIKGKKA